MALHLYAASAGSGKTYNLVQRYLLRCLGGKGSNPTGFIPLLAITFTNKAAGEMKERILSKLQSLAELPPDTSDRYAEALAQSLAIRREELQRRAAVVLKHLLHNYSAFSVSTIDSFTNRLIRSFSRDLEISHNYQVSLETKPLLRSAINQVLDQLEPHSPEGQLLKRYIQQQIEGGRSPVVQNVLMQLGQKLFQENDLMALEALQRLDAQHYLNLEKRWQGEQKAFEAALQERAQKLLRYLDDHRLGPEHFSRGLFYTQTKKIAEGHASENGLPSTYTGTVQKTIAGESPFWRQKDYASQELLSPHCETMRSQAEELGQFYQNGILGYALRQKALRKIHAVGVLGKLQSELQKVKEEENLLPIGDFNRLIQKHLLNQPVPFIYEKTGSRYRHYFIDEFQDTSRLQWHNLWPLLHEALSQEGGSAMLVGDAKQAIYRWRGGEVGQFLLLQSSKQWEGVPVKLSQLPVNYRSSKEIVAFNNAFFAHCATDLSNPLHRELFRAASQASHREIAGRVEVHSLEGEDKHQAQLERCLALVKNCLKRGFQPGDLAILCRSGKEIKALTSFLSEQGLPVISPEGLRLESSPEIQGLLGFWHLCHFPEIRGAALLWWHWVYDCLAPAEDRHQYLAARSAEDLDQSLAHCEAVLKNWKRQDYWRLSLRDKAFSLLRGLGVDLGRSLYLQRFLDALGDWEIREGGGESAFLRWWEEEGHELSLSLPKQAEALQLMTIHKAKGLQFPVVIFAFADLSMGSSGVNGRRDSLWIPGRDVPMLEGLPQFLLEPNKDLELLAQEYPGLKQHLQAQKAAEELDQLNLVYVAFTRAENELYVLCSPKKTTSPQLLDRLQSFFAEEGPGPIWHRGELVWPKSRIEAESPSTALPQLRLATEPWYRRLRFGQHLPGSWQGAMGDAQKLGLDLHDLLAHLEGPEHLDDLIQRYVNQGRWSATFAVKQKKTLGKMLTDPDLEPFFSAGKKRFTERPILGGGKERSIPDRVVVEDNDAWLLDYKTGLPRPEHREQVNKYAASLEEMGYQVREKVLVYLADEGHQLERNWS